MVVEVFEVLFAACTPFVNLRSCSVVHYSIDSGADVALAVVTGIRNAATSKVMSHAQTMANFVSQNTGGIGNVAVELINRGFVSLI